MFHFIVDTQKEGRAYCGCTTKNSSFLTHDDVIKWNIFGGTGPLLGEYNDHQWIPLPKASDRFSLFCAWKMVD